MDFALDQMLHGNQLVGKIVAMSLFVSMYLAMLVPVIFIRINRTRSKTPRPPEVPSRAIRARITPVATGHNLGRAEGWIWFEGPWLVFEGQATNFRLSAAAFRKPPRKSFGGQAFALAWSDSELSMSVFISASPSTRERPKRDAWLSEMDAWRSAAKPREPSVYPSIKFREVPSASFRSSGVQLAINGVAGILSGLVLLVGLTPELQAGLTVPLPTFASSFAFVVFMFLTLFNPAMALMARGAAVRHNRRVDDLISGSRVI
jgi:hypothetical protein